MTGRVDRGGYLKSYDTRLSVFGPATSRPGSPVSSAPLLTPQHLTGLPRPSRDWKWGTVDGCRRKRVSSLLSGRVAPVGPTHTGPGPRPGRSNSKGLEWTRVASPHNTPDLFIVGRRTGTPEGPGTERNGPDCCTVSVPRPMSKLSVGQTGGPGRLETGGGSPGAGASRRVMGGEESGGGRVGPEGTDEGC